MRARPSCKPDPLLVIDIGNTRASLGVYTRGRVREARYEPSTLRRRDDLIERLREAYPALRPQAIGLASVVPRAGAAWRAALKTCWPDRPVVSIDATCRMAIGIRYPRPETIGADRLAAAHAAYLRWGGPIIVADFGTAVTFDVVSRDGSYEGGVIAPGLPLMFDYLHEKTALLPRIEPGPVRPRIGKSTEEAMRMGAHWGYRGMVDAIVERLRQALGDPTVRLCATGGAAAFVMGRSTRSVPIVPHLTLEGVGQIAQRNV